jgi:hypothetical protein
MKRLAGKLKHETQRRRQAMKLMMFEKGKGVALGLVDGKSVIDLGVADPSLPKDLKALIAAGPGALAAAKTAAAKAPASARFVLDAMKPALPIDPPGKIVCVGLNYALHAKEGGHPMPTYPSFFLRVPTSLVAAGAPVIRPKISNQLDYECELTIVIGSGWLSWKPRRWSTFGYTLQRCLRAITQDRSDVGKNFDATGRGDLDHRRRASAGRLAPHHDPRQRRTIRSNT